jgi:hypothetical protein
MGSGPADVVPVRIDPELKAAIEARAEANHTTTIEIIREALRKFLEVAGPDPGGVSLCKCFANGSQRQRTAGSGK